MKKVLTIGGSNSRHSINKTLANFTANMLNSIEVISIDLNDFEMPIYSNDAENETGVPDLAVHLNDLLLSVDGFVVSLAEHNGAYSVAFKNVFDWLSRIDKKVFKDKPMLLMATSPGGRGGQTVLEIAKTSFPHLGGNIVADFSLPNFYDNFKEGQLVNQELKENLNEKIRLLQKALI